MIRPLACDQYPTLLGDAETYLVVLHVQLYRRQATFDHHHTFDYHQLKDNRECKPSKIADGYLEIPSTSFPTISEGIKELPRSDICVINHKKQEEIYTKHTEGKEKEPGYTLFVYLLPICEESDTERSVFQVPEAEAEAFEKWLQEEVQNISTGTRVIILLEEEKTPVQRLELEDK